MQRDYKNWSNKKTSIEAIEYRLFFHEKEIWYCNLGANIGFEQDGKGEDFLRPVLIIRKFNNEIFWGIPLTKTSKKIPVNAIKYYYEFNFVENVKSLAILSQIRLIDSKRLARHIGGIDEDNFINIIKKLKELLP